MTKEEFIKRITDQIKSLTNNDHPDDSEEKIWCEILADVYRKRLKQSHKLFERAESFGLDIPEFIKAWVWFEQNKDSCFGPYNYTGIPFQNYPELIDARFIERLDIARTRHTTDESRELYNTLFYNFFKEKLDPIGKAEGKKSKERYKDYLKEKSDSPTNTRVKKHNKHVINFPKPKITKQEWSRQGGNPFHDDTPDDWENYRTDELID